MNVRDLQAQAYIKEQMFLAVNKNDVQYLKQLLESAPTLDLNFMTRKDNTLLNLSLDKQHDHCTQLLIEKKADVNLDDKEGFPPLHVACKKSSGIILKMLIDAKANVDANKKPENDTPLHKAALHGNTAAITLLLDMKADVNAKNYYNDTPLHLAALHHHVSAVKILLGAKAHVNAQNFSNKTALHMAVTRDELSNQEDTVATLLTANADVTLKDNNHCVPIDFISDYKNILTWNLLEAAEPHKFQLFFKRKLSPSWLDQMKSDSLLLDDYCIDRQSRMTKLAGK